MVPADPVVAFTEIKATSLQWRSQMVWTSDYYRFQTPEMWRDEIRAFETGNEVNCDCEDLMISGASYVYENDLLLPKDYGYSIVLTEPGRSEGKTMDHARAWFRFNGEIYYLDCYSRRGWYKDDHGPFYAREVSYSSYDNPLSYMTGPVPA